MNKNYDPNAAAKVTHQNLPKELQEKFTEDDIYEILDFKYHAVQYEDARPGMKMYEDKGIDISEEELTAIKKAEEAYIKQIGGQ